MIFQTQDDGLFLEKYTNSTKCTHGFALILHIEIIQFIIGAAT